MPSRWLGAWAGISIMFAVPAPASQKPCRDAAGKIVKQQKPKKTITRNRDALGRFAKCDAPVAKPAPRKKK